MICTRIGIDVNKSLASLEKEIFRKSIHICTAFVPLVFHFYGNVVVVLLVLAGIFYFVSEILRQKGISVPLISLITVTAARKRDEDKIVFGPVTLVLGVVLALLLWQEKFAVVGILALALGDGFASLAGKTFGRIQLPFTGGKTAAGSITCFFAIYSSSFIVLKNTEISLILAAAGTVIEALPLKDFDNVFIPVILGGMAQCLFLAGF